MSGRAGAARAGPTARSTGVWLPYNGRVASAAGVKLLSYPLPP